MQVVVQSFGEFKSSQMANAAHRYHTLRQYVTAEPPATYDGPADRRRTYRSLHYLQAAGRRVNPESDLWSYWTNRTFDGLVARSNPQCDLFIGYSGSCLQALRRASPTGCRAVVYRGAPHGEFFANEVDELLRRTGFDGRRRTTGRMTPREHEEFEVADLVWVPSAFTAESLTSYGVDREKIEIFPYGVDLDVFEPNADRSVQPFEVLYVGAVTPEKGVHVLLDALDELDGEDVTATIVGKVDERLKPRINALPNVNAVGWVGRAALANYYQRASLLVAPSFADGFPSVVLEALACGCPVLVTTNVGTRELIEEYDAGSVVEPGSSHALLGSIHAANDARRLREMSANAIEAIRENEFDVESRLAAMATFMDSTLVRGSQ